MEIDKHHHAMTEIDTAGGEVTIYDRRSFDDPSGYDPPLRIPGYLREALVELEQLRKAQADQPEPSDPGWIESTLSCLRPGDEFQFVDLNGRPDLLAWRKATEVIFKKGGDTFVRYLRPEGLSSSAGPWLATRKIYIRGPLSPANETAPEPALLKTELEVKSERIKDLETDLTVLRCRLSELEIRLKNRSERVSELESGVRRLLDLMY